jgi:hypothetical protein
MPELDEFLGVDPEPEAVVATPEVVVEPPEVEAPEPEAAPETPAPTEAPKPEPEDVAGLRSALQAERAKRNDHKGRADRLEGEMAALKAQMEAAVRPAPAAPAPPQQVAIPNPVEDPQGYHAYIQHDMFNRSLNMSEAMLRQQIGDDADVDAKVAVFKKLADANPALRAELQRQAHPYKFVYDHAKRSMAMDEIGPDPMAYRTKLETEIRAKIEAEYAAGAPAPAAVRVALPQSLGTARSAGSRNVPVFNAPESFEDILGVKR